MDVSSKVEKNQEVAEAVETSEQVEQEVKEEVKAETVTEEAEVVAEAETVAEEVEEEPAEEVEETMDDYKEELESTFMTINVGKVVDGTIIGVTDTELIVSFGYISDGIVPVNETFADSENPLSTQYQSGDQVKAEIIKRDDGDGNVVLSLKKALKEVAWEKLEKALAEETILDAKVVRVVKGGLICNVLQAEAFMPASMASTGYVEDLTVFADKDLKVRVMELDKTKDRIIVSHKVVLRMEQDQKKKELLATIQKGDRFTGEVKKNMSFGSFVDIGGVDGLVHINELSWKRVGHPKEVVKEGDKVEVTVINVNRETGKIGLSMKDASNDPWNLSSEELNVGQVYDGTVKRIADFGAFVEIMDGVEGLVHVSQLAKERVDHPKDKVKIGEVVKVKLLSIDPKDKKIRLTMNIYDHQESSEDRPKAHRTGGRSGGKKPTSKVASEIEKYNSDEQATTSLASVFENIKLDN